jgi:hypothetical protein
MKLVFEKLDAACLGAYDLQVVLTEMSPSLAEGLLLHFLAEERLLCSSLAQLYSSNSGFMNSI